MKFTAKYFENANTIDIYEERKAGTLLVNNFVGHVSVAPTVDNINAVITALEALRNDLTRNTEV